LMPATVAPTRKPSVRTALRSTVGSGEIGDVGGVGVVIAI